MQKQNIKFQHIHHDKTNLSLESIALDFDKVLEDRNPKLQSKLEEIILSSEPLAQAFEERRLGISIINLSDPLKIESASVNKDLNIYGASTSKLGILLGAVFNFKNSDNPRRKNSIFDFEDSFKRMIYDSNNLEAGKMYTITSFDSIEKALKEHRLFDNDRGGMWCGGIYVTKKVEDWISTLPHEETLLLDKTIKRSPFNNELFSLSARSGSRFLFLMEQGLLIDSWSSKVIKEFCKEIRTSKFLYGLKQDDPSVSWYGKTGTYEGNLSECALIEGTGYRYIMTMIISEHRKNDVFDHMAIKINNLMREK